MILVQKVENRLFHASCEMQLACLWRHCRHKARNHVIRCVNGTQCAIHMQDSKGILHNNS